MKKVLIITSKSEKTVSWKERESFVAEFSREVTVKLNDIKLIHTTYNDLLYEIKNGATTIHDSLNNIELSQVNLVHFKNWSNNVSEAPVVAAYLKSKGVLFFNSEVLVPNPPGKLAQMFLLGSARVPVPDTFYAEKSKLNEVLSKGTLPNAFEYPLIMKANDGSKGNDNHLITTPKQALKILGSSEASKQFILQNFIPNDGDYRFLFMGLDRDPLVIHRRATTENHLNNTSKGAKASFINLDSLPKEYLQYALKAAKLLGREIGGVDILVDKNNQQVYILEVNGTPALATGFGKSTKQEYFAEFVESMLGNVDEESEE